MIDDVDADEKACGRAVVQLKYCRDRWTGKVPREMHMLKGFEVKGKRITAVGVGASNLAWSQETEPCDQLCVMRPGNIRWPVFYMCWDSGLNITVRAPEDCPFRIPSHFFQLCA